MALIFKEPDGIIKVGNRPVRLAGYKEGEILYYNKLKEEWKAGPVIPGRLGWTDVWHLYGGFEDKAYTLSCDAGQWTKVSDGGTLWTGTEMNGFLFSGDALTVLNEGHYIGSITITLTAIAGKDFHLRIWNETQSVISGFPLGISTTGLGNKTPLNMPIYLEAGRNDVFQIEINSTDGTDPVINDAVFILHYLHE